MTDFVDFQFRYEDEADLFIILHYFSLVWMDPIGRRAWRSNHVVPSHL